jgi:hypothetical protein
MWVQSVLHVGDLTVGLRVHRLDDEERERTAAVFAWLTLQLVGSDMDRGSPEWNDFAHDVLRDHVTFTVPEDRVENLGPAWWNETLGRALVQFVRRNDLAASINRHLEAMRGLGVES